MINLDPSDVLAAQTKLVQIAEQIIQFQKDFPSFKATSWHISPDMSWISMEHEYKEETIYPPIEHGGSCQSDKVILCERKPPACHTILVKI